jgi:hypothetical protein
METTGAVAASQVITRYWDAAESRRWEEFGRLLADDVVYEVPQTRERVRGRQAYVRFNAEFPGDWHLTVERVLGEGRQAASWTLFAVDGQTQHGLTFFEFDDAGLIRHIVDFWPEPYAPPPGRAHLVERY